MSSEEQQYKEKWKHQTAFVMMPFANNNKYIELLTVIRDELYKYGIIAVRTDDMVFVDDSLFKNAKVYMHCADFGIAIFDTITQNEINPNVSLEMGYMLGLGKKVLLLKETRLQNLQTDLMGHLYSHFNVNTIQNDISTIIKKWIEQNNFGNTCCGFTIVTSATLPNTTEYIQKIIEPIHSYLSRLYQVSISYPTVVFTGKAMNNVGLYFKCGNYSIAREVTNNLMKIKEKSHVEVSLLNCEIQGEEDAYTNINGIIVDAKIAICHLSHFRMYLDLCEIAKRHLGRNVDDIQKVKIFISETNNGHIYYQSNFVVRGFAFPTKFYTRIDCGLHILEMLPYLFDGMTIPNNLADLHIYHFHYFISKSIKNDIRIGDANNITFID